MSEQGSLIEQIDQYLPQTQCKECDYAGCKPYAQAIVTENASIDRCAPGGQPVLKKIATLLGTDPRPYLKKVAENTRAPSTFMIDESECIGCTKCIQACPVDAIIGSGKKMHSILSDECTGCGLCVAPCPVDCIEEQAIATPLFNPQTARARFDARNKRLETLKENKQSLQNQQTSTFDMDKKAYLESILKRAQSRHAPKQTDSST